MDLEELKAWANILGVTLEPTGGNQWRITRGGFLHWVYTDQPAEHWLAMIKDVARCASGEFDHI